MSYEMYRFETANFLIRGTIEQDYNYEYDGDDEDGSIQADLNSGEMVAFDTMITVTHKPSGLIIGRDCLCGSVYGVDEYSKFFTDHRDPNPDNRNCFETNAKHQICHYFPSMVKVAIEDARNNLATLKDSI